MPKEKKPIYDVAVVGGGAAGLMAAGRAAELGARVALVEKNDVLGKKLSITGKGRCNLTQAEFDLRALTAAYGPNGKFLFSVFSAFGPEETMRFFADRGLPLKTERGGRVFSASGRSADVIHALRNYLAAGKVEIILGAANLFWESAGRKISKIKFKGGEIIARSYIICTGGKSYPATGSTGEGYQWAERLGHKISALQPALAPLKIKEDWVKKMQGLSLKNAGLSIWQNGRKMDSRFGEMLFTHFGVSGPIVLDISKRVGELLAQGPVLLRVDLKPALDETKLDERVRRDWQKYQNKLFKNSLDDLLPRKMIPVIIALSGIAPEKQVNKISREERKKLVGLLKGLTMEARSLLGWESAIATSGGINLREVDPRTMKSKIIDNLYFAGEVLDIDGPSGGYNLQAAWSTGYAAGENAAKKTTIESCQK